MLPSVEDIIEDVILGLVALSKQLERLDRSGDSYTALEMARDVRGLFPFDFES
jgi:hypothetical protein